jgi:dihydrofolate reductase
MITEFSVIVACSLNGGIGKDNNIPWYIPADFKHFKSITSNCPNGCKNVVIMGRNTWNSLPKKPLPNRVNVIVSSTLNIDKELFNDTYNVSSLDDALHVISSIQNIHNVFVIGGSQLYKEALTHTMCSKAYITHVLKHITCDVLFPLETLFKYFPVCDEGSIHTHNDLLYCFCTYTKALQ